VPVCAFCALLQEILVNVAPKKANWDLRRDIADKLTRLERRTQVPSHSGLIRLMCRLVWKPSVVEG
jgi:hypothetical protein